MSTATTPVPEFKFEQDSSQDAKVVSKAAPVEAYLVEYKDGEGKVQTRIAFRLDKTMFIIQERIHGSLVVTPAVDWFNNSFTALVEENQEPESI